MTLATEAYASVERFHSVSSERVGFCGTVVAHKYTKVNYNKCMHASARPGMCSHPVCQVSGRDPVCQALSTLVLSDTGSLHSCLQVSSTGCALCMYVVTV